MQKNTGVLPPIDLVSGLLSYDPETGELRWKRSAGKAKIGSVAGCNAQGYTLVGVNGRLYKAHRLAWLLHYGESPTGDIDHVNGNRSDNRIVNLRIASHSENMHNRKADRDNKSGAKGVCWNKWRGKWMAYSNGKHVGYFNTKESADKAVRVVRERLHREFACHRV